MTVGKKREAFLDKRGRMKQCKSLVDINNIKDHKLKEIASGNNSDSDIPYTYLLTNDVVMDTVCNSAGTI